MPAGELRQRFTFYSVPSKQGGWGQERGTATLEFTVSGKCIPKFGGEAVEAARLTSRQPYMLTVRNSSFTRQITTDWYCVRLSDGMRFNIRTIADPNQKRQWLELLIESGVAA